MRRLFWKEWRERQVWIALWVVVGAVATALGKGQNVCNIALDNTSPWMMLIPLTAGLAGLAGYGSELHGGRAAFLYSRAISWKQVLAAKLLLGLAVVVGSVIVNMAAGCLLLPAEYHPLITLHGLALGALIMAGLTAGAYLFGLVFSVVLPGVAGSLLVVVGWTVLFNVFSLIGFKVTVFGPILLILTPLVAGVILARFGVTLNSMARLRRFAFIVLVCVAAGFLLDYTPPARFLYKLGNSGPVNYLNANISPDARYAYVYRVMSGQDIPCLARLADGRFSFLGEGYPGEIGWLANGNCLQAFSGADKEFTLELHVLQWNGQELRTYRIKNSGNLGLMYHALSPDGRNLLIGGVSELQLCDLTTGEIRVVAKVDRAKLRRIMMRDKGRLNGLLWCWWQSNDEVGSLDPFTKQRVIISLPELSEP